MNAEVKQLWNNALLSGEYVQGRNALKKTYEGKDKFCVFGVLCDLYQKVHPESYWTQYDVSDQWFFIDGMERRSMLPTGAVMNWAELTDVVIFVSYKGVQECLTTLNDLNVSFAEIAQIIEEQL